MIVFLPFGQMQNAECKMQNECISFGNNLNRAEGTPSFCIMHFELCIGQSKMAR